jgi:cytochrome b subunit of formate dehydrogenase
MTRMRASATERTLHWSVASAVLTLIATGTVMYVPWLSQILGQRFWIRTTHLGAAVWLIAAMLVIPALRWKDVLRLERKLSVWDQVDMDWFRRPWDVFRSVYEPGISASRRFNAGKKLLAVMVGVALALLLVSGVPMYSWWWFSGELVQRARDLHVLVSFGLTALIAGHIYLAAFGPSGLLKWGSGHESNPVLEDAAR